MKTSGLVDFLGGPKSFPNRSFHQFPQTVRVVHHPKVVASEAILQENWAQEITPAAADELSQSPSRVGSGPRNKKKNNKMSKRSLEVKNRFNNGGSFLGAKNPYLKNGTSN